MTTVYELKKKKKRPHRLLKAAVSVLILAVISVIAAILITNNGKPMALLVDLLEGESAEALSEALCLARARLALTDLRALSRRNGTGRLTGTQIDAEVRAALRWGANVIRWQLSVPKEARMDKEQFRAIFRQHMKNLDEHLPLLTRLGLNVIVDMHCPPGGRYRDGIAGTAGIASWWANPGSSIWNEAVM